jgi:hypothetical protein
MSAAVQMRLILDNDIDNYGKKNIKRSVLFFQKTKLNKKVFLNRMSLKVLCNNELHYFFLNSQIMD